MNLPGKYGVFGSGTIVAFQFNGVKASTEMPSGG